jgi:drug/metabolite transporter (DMT)-like permease
VQHRQLTAWDIFFCFFIVLGVYLLARSFLIDVKPILYSENMKNIKDNFELLALILGILAAGCTAIFFSFTYKDAGDKEHELVQIMAWSLIIAFSLLVFLCIYCLQKIGAFDHMDKWARFIVFMATFLMLYGLILIERWDATLLTRKSKECPFCNCWISTQATRCPKCTSDLSQSIK